LVFDSLLFVSVTNLALFCFKVLHVNRTKFKLVKNQVMLLMRMIDTVEFKFWWTINSLKTINPASNSTFQCFSSGSCSVVCRFIL